MNYAVINSQTNIVENAIIWDGVAQWAPPDGCYVEPLGDSCAGIGWTKNEDGSFSPPVEQN
jgi:hypothetical protein